MTTTTLAGAVVRPDPSRRKRRRATAWILTLAVVTTAFATAYVHFTLGGLLFLLNGIGYVGLAGLILVGAVGTHPVIRRFSWFPRLSLAGYAGVTIAGYLVVGPYFALGWITKAIEVLLIALVILDVRSVYGGLRPMLSVASSSVAGLRGVAPQVSPPPVAAGAGKHRVAP